MAKKQNKIGDEKVEVTLRQGTRIAGEPYEAGDTVEVYETEKRHLIFGGFVDGDLKDAASPAEVAQGNLDEGRGATGYGEEVSEATDAYSEPTPEGTSDDSANVAAESSKS